jgi:hypothetical protein
MPATTERILIRRPRLEVAAYMDDVTRESEWQPALLEASQDPPGPTGVGTRKRYVSEFLGRRVTNTYVATAVEPGRRVAYETTRDSTVRATMVVAWDDADGGTRVTLTMDGKATGVLRFVPRAMLEEAWQRQLRATLERLKERLEAAA